MAKVQISQQAFLSIRYFLCGLDTDGLSDRDKKSYEAMEREIEEKYNKLYDRMRYGEALKANSEDEKKALLDLYHKKKGKGM